MRTKQVVLLLGLLIAGSAMLFAAGGKEAPGAAGTAGGKVAFPDAFPVVPKPVDPKVYAYDDMNKKYDFEIMTYGYVVAPLADNPITTYMSKKMNANITFTDVASPDLNNQVTVRFAANNPPDLIHLSDKNVALTLFEQGQTMAVDGILQYTPQAMDYVTKVYKNWATAKNGQMFGIPRYSTFPNNWGLFVRADWLKKFGLNKPTNENELFEFAKACVENDPNGNGKADTWFMGGAGGGKSFTMLEPFRSMFGHPSWNVKDGKINHPMLDGTTRDFLKFLKKLYDAKTLQPDWYTIEWEQFKSFSMNDQIGMVDYPGWNLIQEYWVAHKQDLAATSVWEPIDPPKAADGRGGMYPPGVGPGGLFLFPKKLEKEDGKLKRILHTLDTIIYPNVNYWVVTQGGDDTIWPGTSRHVFSEKDGTNVYQVDFAKHPARANPKMMPLLNWTTLAYTLLWEVYDDPMGMVGSKWNRYVDALPRYTNYDIMLTLDAEKAAKLAEFAAKAEIGFVLGQRSFADWDKYVDEWKQAGGTDLMKQAAKQLGVSD